MTSVRYLYRGVSEKHYEETGGQLKPKSNTPFASYVRCGQSHARCGSGVIADYSSRNEVIKHQDYKGGVTSGISTSPFFERAVFYATRGGTLEYGFVYTINREKLESLDVEEFIVADHTPCPWKPEDEEVILVAKDNGCVPDAVVVVLEKVRSGQKSSKEM